MKTKTVTQLFDEFKTMTLSKQTLIAVATITLLVTFFSNYKEIKNGTKQLACNFAENENIKEFMDDVKSVIGSFAGICKKFIKKPIETTSEVIETIND